MSKNQDRYKEDYITLAGNLEKFDELETKKFEKFKKKTSPAQKTKSKKVNRDNE